jgi:3-oxoacyl-[acyl-carrier protein] reductase
MAEAPAGGGVNREGKAMDWAEEFRGKRVVITGAGGIFGGRFAAAFAARGALLCLADHRRERLEAVAARLGLDRGATLLAVTDLTDAGAVRDLAGQVAAAWGAPDIVINNAGVYPATGTLLELEVEEWDRIFAVNLRAPFLVTREMAKLMIGRGVEGAVVNIGSGAARQMRTRSVPYCTSKTALERLTKGQALELAPQRIRVNLVEPGFAPGSDFSPLSDERSARKLAGIPLGRASGEEDAAAAVLYLCSRAAAFVTGAVLAVDGGNSIGTYEPAAKD